MLKHSEKRNKPSTFHIPYVCDLFAVQGDCCSEIHVIVCSFYFHFFHSSLAENSISTFSRFEFKCSVYFRSCVLFPREIFSVESWQTITHSIVCTWVDFCLLTNVTIWIKYQVYFHRFKHTSPEDVAVFVVI